MLLSALDVGVVWFIHPGVCAGAGSVCRGGVVGRKEGFSAMDHPGARWGVVVGGGEGVVATLHEGHVCVGAGWWFVGVGMS